jgi:hypothetical protein
MQVVESRLIGLPQPGHGGRRSRSRHREHFRWRLDGLNPRPQVTHVLMWSSVHTRRHTAVTRGVT